MVKSQQKTKIGDAFAVPITAMRTH